MKFFRNVSRVERKMCVYVLKYWVGYVSVPPIRRRRFGATVSALDISAPEILAPDISAPDVSASDISAPDISAIFLHSLFKKLPASLFFFIIRKKKLGDGAEMSGAEISGAEMSSAETVAPNRRRRNVPDPEKWH